jgi:hypothetical protein
VTPMIRAKRTAVPSPRLSEVWRAHRSPNRSSPGCHWDPRGVAR